MASWPAPMCLECVHYNQQSIDRLGCKAYPRAIPAAIIKGEHDHRQPYKGDNGIRFKARPKTQGEV